MVKKHYKLVRRLSIFVVAFFSVNPTISLADNNKGSMITDPKEVLYVVAGDKRIYTFDFDNDIIVHVSPVFNDMGQACSIDLDRNKNILYIGSSFHRDDTTRDTWFSIIGVDLESMKIVKRFPYSKRLKSHSKTNGLFTVNQAVFILRTAGGGHFIYTGIGDLGNIAISTASGKIESKLHRAILENDILSPNGREAMRVKCERKNDNFFNLKVSSWNVFTGTPVAPFSEPSPFSNSVYFLNQRERTLYRIDEGDGRIISTFKIANESSYPDDDFVILNAHETKAAVGLSGANGPRVCIIDLTTGKTNEIPLPSPAISNLIRR